MRKMFGLMCVLGLWLLPQLGHAQKKAPNDSLRRYSLSRFEALYGRVFDERMSRHAYGGPGIGFATANERELPHLREAFSAGGRALFLSPPHGRSSLQNYWGEISYQYLRKVDLPTLDRWQCFVGGEAFTMVNTRFNSALGNSALSAEGIGGLGATAWAETVRKVPLLKGPSRLGFRIQLPLLSYGVTTPSYGLSGTLLSPVAHGLAPIGVFNRVKTEISLTRRSEPTNPNMWRISYSWDFYAYDQREIHRLRYATHSIALTLLVRKGRIAPGT